MTTIVPIYDEAGKFLGMWAQNRNFSPTLESLAELKNLAEPTFIVLTNRGYTRTENYGIVCVGSNVEFQDGVFLMKEGEKPPTEEIKAGRSFLAVYHGGIPIVKRLDKPLSGFYPQEDKAFSKKESVSSLKQEKYKRPTKKHASEHTKPTPSHKPSKPWWRFW